MAAVALAQERPKRAARLLGAAAALRETIGYPVRPARRADYDRLAAAVRTALGEGAAEGWAAGQGMTMEQAVEYALSESPADGAQ